MSQIESLCHIPTSKPRLMPGTELLTSPPPPRPAAPAEQRGPAVPPLGPGSAVSRVPRTKPQMSAFPLRVRAVNAGTSHNRNVHLWSLSQGQPQFSCVASVAGGPEAAGGGDGGPLAARQPPCPGPCTVLCPGAGQGRASPSVQAPRVPRRECACRAKPSTLKLFSLGLFQRLHLKPSLQLPCSSYAGGRAAGINIPRAGRRR